MSAAAGIPAVQAPERAAALGVFLLLLGLYTATFAGLPDNPDAEVEFQTVSSLARRHTLALGGTPEADAIVATRFDVAPGGPGREGRFYSWFGLGQAAVALPFYAVGKGLERLFPGIEERHAGHEDYGSRRSEYFAHLVVGWRNPLLGALTAMLLVSSARRLGASRRSAWIAALSYGSCTFAWPQARSTLSDVQAAFFLALAFHQLLAARERTNRGEAPGRAGLLVLGAALGMAFLTRVLCAPAVAVLFVAAACVAWSGATRLVGGSGRRGRSALAGSWLACVSAPLAAAMAVFLYANWLRFGNPLESGYGAGVSRSFFSHPPLLGLAGILAAPGKGLLWFAPGVLLVPLGWARARAVGEGLWRWVVIALAVVVGLPVITAGTWHGAWTFGPRYVLPLLPFLWMGVALGLDRVAAWSGAGTRVAAVGLVVSGLVPNLGGALVDHMAHQDLALQAARVEWPDADGGGVEGDPRVRDEGRFQRIQWDWRFAAPWAHWRILRLRLASDARGVEEKFLAREVFFVGVDEVLVVEHERERGFLHLAWVWLEMVGGTGWLGIVLVGGLIGAGSWWLRKGIAAAG